MLKFIDVENHGDFIAFLNDKVFSLFFERHCDNDQSVKTIELPHNESLSICTQTGKVWVSSQGSFRHKLQQVKIFESLILKKYS